ncbi:C69 family dipeptidase [Francisellaceae bacterium]|nr:C69 family dipeptidase [Francisellaceae bacterium]
MTLSKTFTSVIVGCAASIAAEACTTILVGKDASTDGSIIISRNSDSHSAINAKHLVIHQDVVHLEKTYFKSSSNAFTYELPKMSYQYIGLPYWYTNDHSMEQEGSNAFGVTISATESIYNNPKALEIDPYNKKTGISEDAITTIILQSVTTAREGIELLGSIITTKGTAEGFGVAIGDKDEVWYLETAAGHLWAAAKVPDDSYFVSANQSRLQQINLADKQNYLGSPNLIAFAKENKLFTGNDKEFVFRKAYARYIPEDVTYNFLRVWTLQNMYSPELKFSKTEDDSPTFLKPEKKISVNEVMTGLRNHYQGTANDPYVNNNYKEPYRPISVFRESNSHVTAVRNNLPIDIANIVYIALGMNSLSIYLPFYSSISQVPEPYKLGNDHSSDDSAYWIFRKVQTLAMLDFENYAPIVQKAYAKLFDKIETKRIKMEKEYLKLHKKNITQARTKVQAFIDWEVNAALDLAKKLANELMTLETIKINNKYEFPGA